MDEPGAANGRSRLTDVEVLENAARWKKRALNLNYARTCGKAWMRRGSVRCFRIAQVFA